MNSQIEDYYRELDLEPGADLSSVRQSYRQLVKVWHPDRFGSDQKLQTFATDKLKKINCAYESLVSFIENGRKEESPPPPEPKPKTEPSPSPSAKSSVASDIYRTGLARLYARDFKGAANFFLQAAEMGDAQAQYAYGYIRYQHGVGHFGIFNANKHFATVLRWWTKAAEQGHTDAQFMVGTFHQTGFCTPYDEAEARKWLERAAARGHSGAKEWLNKSVLRKLHAIPLVKLVLEPPPGAPMPR